MPRCFFNPTLCTLSANLMRASLTSLLAVAMALALALVPLISHAGDELVSQSPSALQSAQQSAPQLPLSTRAPIRFLLTFDDGPDDAQQDNPTEKILDALADNAVAATAVAANEVQSGIKAIFFTQVGDLDAVQRQLLQREQNDGHVLAFHTATPGHANHRYLEPDELDLSLEQGGALLRSLSGTSSLLLRPPYWSYDKRTLAAYDKHHMHMLLTDLSANDGKIHGVNWSWRKRQNMLDQLTKVRVRWLAGEMPEVEGSTPVIVTFHDLNTYTARNIVTYLKILQEVAQELQMPTADQPFYDERGAILRAAMVRTVQMGDPRPPLPGLWNWIWN